jgi:acyl carrier protein
VSSNDDCTPEDDPALREALKRCSPATYYAACKFRKTKRDEDLRTVVVGVIERFVERDVRPKLANASDSLRLSEDLGIDSLTMMEIVMVAEDVLRISVSNEELTQLRTLGQVQAFILQKIQSPATPLIVRKPATEADGWNLAAVGDEVRRIESNAAQPSR